MYVIMDNLSANETPAIRTWAAKNNVELCFTPASASWANPISVVQRKVLTPSDFTDLDQVTNRLRAFEDRYNATAQPFQWKFTASDLDDLLARLDRHTTDGQEKSFTTLAA
jgi:hypothetical protein